MPGQSTLVYPAGFAKFLPKGARLRFQMHYTPNGTATTDRTRVGVIFADEPPRHEVRVAGIVNPRIRIPPGAADHREEASLRLPFDATIMGFLPHLHVRGKACRYEVTRAGGTPTTLLDIPRYDFNWQLLYRLREPLAVEAGDTLTFTAWYDNSVHNPANPDPTTTVRWGPQTFDESERPPQPALTALIASRVDTFQPNFNEATHDSTGRSAEGRGMAAAAAAVHGIRHNGVEVLRSSGCIGHRLPLLAAEARSAAV